MLPNTAGCFTVEDAVTTAQLGRELFGHGQVKLEVIGDERTLFPDVPATIEAARILVEDDFEVLPYISDDPVACQRLAALGCAAVMPLAAPIGSGLGIRNPANLRIIFRCEFPTAAEAYARQIAAEALQRSALQALARRIRALAVISAALRGREEGRARNPDSEAERDAQPQNPRKPT